MKTSFLPVDGAVKVRNRHRRRGRRRSEWQTSKVGGAAAARGVWGGSKKGAVGVVRKERGKTDHEKPFKLCNLTPTNGQCSADRICGHQIFTRIQIGSMTVLLWYLSRLACI